MKRYLLFDLDGTLTDPKIGITTCVQYALQSMGIEEPDLDVLEPFIGPPLKTSFMEFYDMTEEQAEQAIVKYRERFHDTGIYENIMYDGIPEMLRDLKSKGMKLGVASSKAEVYVKRILEHFNIIQYFDVIVGSELDGTRVEKEEVIQEALKRMSSDKTIQPNQVYMIGDRKFDIEGAKAAGMESVGVTYGYGGMEELKEAKADYIVRSVLELSKFLLRGTGEQEKVITPFQRIWQMAFPFLMFMMIRQLAISLLLVIVANMGNFLTGALFDFFFVTHEPDKVIFTANAEGIIVTLSFIAAGVAIRKPAKAYIQWAKEDTKLFHLIPEAPKQYFFMFLSTIGAVIGINLLFELLNFTSNSERYQAVHESQSASVFGIGFLCYVLITPIAEELLFRGIIFNAMKRFMNLKMAVILSAFVFGAYHMNSVQTAYGFLIGLLIAYGYVYFGSFYVPVAIHMLANFLATLINYSRISTTTFVSWPVCLVFLAIAGGSIFLLVKEKRVL